MLIDPTVPHIGIYMPAEIRHLRKVVRKIMSSEPTSSRSEEISVGVARRVFDAYNSGSMEMEELLLLGEMEKHRLIDRNFSGEQEPDALKIPDSHNCRASRRWSPAGTPVPVARIS